LIGQSLAELSSALKASKETYPFEAGITTELLNHDAENIHYIEQKWLETVSCTLGAGVALLNKESA